MKKYKILISLFVLLMCGFTSSIGDGDMNTSADEIDVGYSVDSLDSFFSGRCVNDVVLRRNRGEPISFDEVMKQYSVVRTRYDDRLDLPFSRHQPLYSIIRVKEGGYYYLFWVVSIQNETASTVLGFYAYISNTTTVEISMLEKGADISSLCTITPYTELSILQSNGSYCYIYLDAENLIEIECIFDNSKTPPSYRIVEAKLQSRKSSPSFFALLQDCDLPN